MKFYIASRAKRAKSVQIIAKNLKKRGCSLSFDWTSYINVQPYDKKVKQSEKIAKLAIGGVKNCDVFVILTDRAGTGMHSEFGIALAEKKKIYVIGKHLNTNIFFFYPGVRRVASINEFLKSIK